VAAAYYACESLCIALLNAGADINARTNDGTTPLMLAAKSAKLRLVKLLIEKGANPKLTDNKGKTAYDYALSADPLTDLPEFRKQMEEACGFNKSETVLFLKERVAK
jgi:ankyrin repeat protein